MDFIPDSPLILLLALWMLSALFRRFVIGDGEAPVPAGSVVMAGGIFAIAALVELPLPPLVGRVLVLELLIIWGFLAYSYVRSAIAGGLSDTLRQPVGAFAVGTWVAGSAVLGRAFVEVLPEWQPLAFALWVVAVAVWFFYLGLLPGAYRNTADGSVGFRATGVVLLPVVATQSIVVSGDAVLAQGLPGWVSAGLILSGGALYIFGLLLVLSRYTTRRDWSVADDWDDSNCILHGALSISGLAILQSGVLPAALAVGIWFAALGLFVLVEGAEALRAIVRVRSYGLKDGLLVYHTPQWSRNFTFGMFYAFTLQLRQSDTSVSLMTGVREIIVAYGKYMVFALLLVEVALFLSDRVRSDFMKGKTVLPEED